MEMESFWMLCQLSFRSYIPQRLEKGMMFLKNDNGEPSVFLLEKLPPNEEEFLKDVGYPIEPYIVLIDDLDEEEEEVIAEPHEIGWMDEGEYVDELVDVECRHFNRMLSGYEGNLEIEMTIGVDEEGEEIWMPVLYEDKVTLRYVTDDEESLIINND